MTDNLKPTNDEIAEYIYKWIESFDENGLIIVDDNVSIEGILLEGGDFLRLRKLFKEVKAND